MPSFGNRSMGVRSSLDKRLVKILDEAILVYDFTLICGHRTEEAQNEAFATGASKKQYPDSKHNSWPSIAVDVAPWPINWNDSLAFARLYGIIEAIAHDQGLELRWGGDWDRDGGSRDQSFMDIGHLELVP